MASMFLSLWVVFPTSVSGAVQFTLGRVKNALNNAILSLHEQWYTTGNVSHIFFSGESLS